MTSIFHASIFHLAARKICLESQGDVPSKRAYRDFLSIRRESARYVYLLDKREKQLSNGPSVESFNYSTLRKFYFERPIFRSRRNVAIRSVRSLTFFNVRGFSTLDEKPWAESTKHPTIYESNNVKLHAMARRSRRTAFRAAGSYLSWPTEFITPERKSAVKVDRLPPGVTRLTRLQSRATAARSRRETINKTEIRLNPISGSYHIGRLPIAVTHVQSSSTGQIQSIWLDPEFSPRIPEYVHCLPCMRERVRRTETK